MRGVTPAAHVAHEGPLTMFEALNRAATPGTGSIIAGKYRLEESLGVGSMGAVWRGVHLMLGHSVAVKLLRHSVASSELARARFVREAKISARLGDESRHIARVHDYGLLDDGSPFVVMELLKGETLAARMSRKGTLSLSETSRIVAQLCRALSVAHKAGVLHRDLKPANVFLCDADDARDTHGPLVKLVDFGVAKMLEHESFQPTHSGEIIGTPGYMSPEQLSAETPLDGRSDLWALAAMVYRMVTGQPPFGVGNIVELGFRIVSTEAPPPSSIVEGLPRAVDAWVAKGLAKRPEDRFQTAAELAGAFASAIGSRAGSRASVSGKSIASFEAATASAHGRVLGIAAAAVAVVTLLGVIAVRVAPERAPSVRGVFPAHEMKASIERVLPSTTGDVLSAASLVPHAAPPSASAVRSPPRSPRRSGAAAPPRAPSVAEESARLWRKKDEL